MRKGIFKILDTPASLIRKVSDYFRQTFSPRFRRVSAQINADIRLVLRQKLYSSDTVFNLIFGKLQLDFGLTDDVARQVVYEIVEAVVNQVVVDYDPNGKDLVTLRVTVNPPPIAQLLLIRNASYTSINAAGEASEVPWLKWLLTRGTQVVVKGYNVKYGDYRRLGHSRTKQAIMIKTYSDPFRVDPEFAGTEDDNFITRAILAATPEIQDIVYKRVTQ